jgi:purine-nucleoside phosphorylase
VGFSTITNLAAGLSGQPLSHAEVLEVGKQTAAQLNTLIKGVLRGLGGRA